MGPTSQDRCDCLETCTNCHLVLNSRFPLKNYRCRIVTSPKCSRFLDRCGLLLVIGLGVLGIFKLMGQASISCPYKILLHFFFFFTTLQITTFSIMRFPTMNPHVLVIILYVRLMQLSYTTCGYQRIKIFFYPIYSTLYSINYSLLYIYYFFLLK